MRFRASPSGKHRDFEMTPTSPPQTGWQMTVTGQNAYRGLRMPILYPGVQW
jgi:hypothetical protein